jgi:hypothetical protein
MGRFVRRRGRAAVILTALICSVSAAAAYAYTATITDQSWVGPNGVFGPRHSITRVYVHDLDGPGYSCENAWSSEEGWVQSSSYCTRRGDTWHDFCGCRLRYGWNGSGGNYTEKMNGHENY